MIGLVIFVVMCVIAAVDVVVMGRRLQSAIDRNEAAMHELRRQEFNRFRAELLGKRRLRAVE